MSKVSFQSNSSAEKDYSQKWIQIKTLHPGDFLVVHWLGPSTCQKKKKKKRMKEKHIHTHNSVTLPYHSGYSTQKHKFLPYPPIFFLKEITIISLGLFWHFLNTVTSPVCSLQYRLNKEVKEFSFPPSP